jgi:hypothetical protein
MQSDAHVTFTRNWDEDIISQQEATRNEMAVMSTYLTDIVGSIDENGDSMRNTRPIMCNTDYEDGQNSRYLRHGSQPEAQPTIRELMIVIICCSHLHMLPAIIFEIFFGLGGEPQLEPYWAAGYSFSRGHFVVNVPYDFYQPVSNSNCSVSLTYLMVPTSH